MSEMKFFHDVLKKHGYSITKSREAVFKALESQEPQSMHELVKRLSDDVDRASVYRTVALFEKLGIVQRLQIGWKYKLELTDLFHHHHHHISCVKCGLVAPLREDRTLEASMQALAYEYGFEPQSHQIEIQGLCSRCKASS